MKCGRLHTFLLASHPIHRPSQPTIYTPPPPAPAQLFYYPWQGDYTDVMLAKLLNPLNCLMQAATVIVQQWGSLGGLIPSVRGRGRRHQLD